MIPEEELHAVPTDRRFQTAETLGADAFIPSRTTAQYRTVTGCPFD